MTALPPAAAAAELMLPRRRVDYLPLYALLAVLAAALLWVGDGATWLTLTVAGLAMGMLLFIMASGLTMVFGLMGVMNFGHGAFITVGAYAATLVLLRVSDWLQAPSVWLNCAALGLAVLVAMAVTALLGWLYERLVIRRVYGNALMQILITFGAATVVQELVTAIWGAELIPLTRPAVLDGAFVLGEAEIEKFRLLCAMAGLLVFGAMMLVLHGTRIGLLVRAGVENGEMVEALGYRVRTLFVGVFVAGSALAGMGGVLWGLYRQELTTGIGASSLVSILIVIIVGGLGSVGGCFLASLLVALASNYVGFLAPKAALLSEVGLMLVVLAWRPRGLYPVTH
ncbi:MAG: branched-chain amino acid ABC transporter permease [Sphingomonadaceae bacterium]